MLSRAVESSRPSEIYAALAAYGKRYPNKPALTGEGRYTTPTSDFTSYLRGWLQLNKGEPMTRQEAGGAILINTSTMQFVKRCDSVRQCELWTQILHPGDKFHILNPVLNRHYSAFSEDQLQRLYLNTTGERHIKNGWGFSELLHACAEHGLTLETDRTGLDILQNRLGLGTYRPPAPVVPDDAPWLVGTNNPGDRPPPPPAPATVRPQVPTTKTKEAEPMAKANPPAPPGAPAAPAVPAVPKAPKAAKKVAAKKAAKAPKAPAAPKAAKKAKPAKAAAKPKAPKANAKPVKAPKAPRIEKNGVFRPKAGGLCAAVWDIADQISAKNKAPAEAAEVFAAGKKMKLNEGNIRIEFQKWRKFNGVASVRAAK